ncbi:hypothetical protein ACFYW6_23915 [Streptomyces sp. NPDC002659]|uniref:hypothetical protein n=1 Tax=Streptomyces sp. NPDC002659 TaxID=3364656 RepID=UPI0036C663C6
MSGTPEAASPFAGQTLHVLFAVTDLDPGPVNYLLDDGGMFPASWHVHTLLAMPMGSQTTPSTPACDHPYQPRLETAITDGDRRYVLTATRHDDGLLSACTFAGDIQGELCGDIDFAHLRGLARLLDSAARAAPKPAAAPAPAAPCVSAPRHGASWTDEESARLADRYRHERDFAVLGQEFGRSPLAIQHQLARLELAHCPTPPRPTAQTVPVPKQTHGHALEERRQTHSRSHERWTQAEEEELALRCAQGAMADELSKEFGRTEGAIEARLRLIGARGPAADKARMHDF